MIQDHYLQYKGACHQLFQKKGDTVTFLGSAFLVHSGGYLLTLEHLVTRRQELMVMPWSYDADAFVDMYNETIMPMPVQTVQSDRDCDLALLQLDYDHEITVPDHVVGRTEDIIPGTEVVCLGFPFGFYNLHTQLIQRSIIGAKVYSRNKTQLLMINTMIHDGSRGGPLISQDDGRVLGVLGGRFDPRDASPLKYDMNEALNTNVSYAVSIEHAVAMMEAEGLEIG